MPWDETKQYIRSGHRNVDDFDSDSLRTITIDEEQGINAVTGCPKGQYEGGKCQVGTEIQSYLFDKSKGWTMNQAFAWFDAHKELLQYDRFGRVTINFDGVAKPRDDDTFEIAGEIPNFEPAVVSILDKHSAKEEVMDIIEKKEARIAKLESQVNALTDQLRQLANIEEVKELLRERRIVQPITRLAHTIPEDHKIEYGIKTKLSLSETVTQKRGQQGLVAPPSPAKDKIKEKSCKHLRDWVS